LALSTPVLAAKLPLSALRAEDERLRRLVLVRRQVRTPTALVVGLLATALLAAQTSDLTRLHHARA
jgi:hypothetical protein